MKIVSLLPNISVKNEKIKIAKFLNLKAPIDRIWNKLYDFKHKCFFAIAIKLFKEKPKILNDSCKYLVE